MRLRIFAMALVFVACSVIALKRVDAGHVLRTATAHANHSEPRAVLNSRSWADSTSRSDVAVSASFRPEELDFNLPDPTLYRSQMIAREKHEGAGIAAALRDFSERMTELMERAVASDVFAEALFERLRDCALQGESALLQARTICAVNAIRLGDAHPSRLSENAQILRDSLAPETRQAVEAMGY